MADELARDNPELDKLFEKYRKSPESHAFAPLADACRKVGRLEEAIEICESGIKTHPGYTSGHVVLGKCFYDQGMEEKAFAAFKQVLEIDPENLVALKFLGILLVERGDQAGAMDYYKRILALDPENQEIRKKIGKLLEGGDLEVMDLRDVEDEDFEGEEITLGEDDAATSDELATVTLADIFASQGYTEKAIKIYQEALHKDPGNKALIAKLKAITGEVSPESDTDEPPIKTPTRSGSGNHTPIAREVGWDGSEPGEAESNELSEDSVDEILEKDIETAEPSTQSSREQARDKAGGDENPSGKSSGKGGTPSQGPISENMSFEHFKKWLRSTED